MPDRDMSMQAARGVSRLIQRVDHALHIDFCPNLNRYVYWLRHPLVAIAVAALAALVCGIWVNPLGLLVSGILIVLGVLGTLWPRYAASGLEGELSFLSPRIRIGEPVVVRLRVSNRRWFPVWGLSLRRGMVRSQDPGQGVAVACLPGRSTIELDWTFVPGERGVYPFQMPRLDTGFPFGLLHAEAPITVLSELVVWPRSVSLDTLPDAVEIQLREQRFTDRRVGDSGDLLGTRTYRAGDSLRRIHWAQTARHGRLIVTERQAPSSCAVSLTVDVSAHAHHSCGEVCTLETTLSVAASIIETLHRHHASIDCCIGSDRYSIGESQRDLHRALDALARVPRHGAECPALRELSRSGAVRVATALTITGDVQGALNGAYGRDRVVLVSNTDHSHALFPVPGSSWLILNAAEALEECLPSQWRSACLAH